MEEGRTKARHRDHYDAMCAVIDAAKALRAKIGDMTSEEFSRGGERAEREAFDAAVSKLGDLS